ncbi:uncharacterized protein LOC124254447 [Haliotis rubra]|uniref:uncharacterized protein LOC124254447 n=1 Tax=Haliotis rubra TaxID=36100 RepID=UPI001EE623A1|nr:uncharacterized protein LOC124254447 [Haliotis rubra]
MTAVITPGLPETVIDKISHGLAEDWHKFGIHIGFSSIQLQNLQASFQTMGLCCAVARMLDKWGKVVVQSWKMDKSMQFLGNILDQIERRDIVEDLNLEQVNEATFDFTLDLEIVNKLKSICLCLKWSPNIDVRLLSRVQKWKEDCDLFYKTRAYKQIRRIVDEKGIVIITGKQGDGKTFLAEHLVLHYLSLGYEVATVNSPKEWRQRWNPNIKQIIFIDDVFGKTQAFPSLALEQWALLGQEMTECIGQGHTKVISTVRDYIHKDCQGIVRGVEIFRNIVNISSDEWKLTFDEKFRMLELHLKHFDVSINKNKMKEIAQNDYIQGFPLRCRIFFSDQQLKKQGVSFFLGHLADVLVDELNYLKQTDKIKYFALVMLLFWDGIIPEETFKSGKEQGVGTRIVKFLGLKSPEPVERLFTVLRTELGLHDEIMEMCKLHEVFISLTGTYVIKVGPSFRFVHESVAEALAYIFGNSPKYQDFYITHCSFLELQQRVLLSLSDCAFRRNPCSVTINAQSFSTLAERLTLEVERGHASDLLNDSRFFKKGFPEHWKNYLSGLEPKKLKNILDLKDKRGNSFASLVARQGCVPLLEFVISTTSTPTASQLMLQAASTGKTEAVEMLLNKGANINQKTSLGQTALLLSSVEGHISLANFLLEKGAGINITDTQGCSPLHSASAHGQLSIVQQLLERGANINCCDSIGSTAIFYASLKGHLEIVQTLIDHGADITMSNTFGGQPLLAACVNGHMAVIQSVLVKKPDLNHKDFNGKTCLHWASQRGFSEIVETLIGKGAEVNLKDEKLQTPLHLAALKGHTHIWRILVASGANMYSTDRDGNTPVALANKESKIPFLFD